jgi:demethoxyubiquinone hydroxylase (CLK1/Coq7/Cat5 family)
MAMHVVLNQGMQVLNSLLRGEIAATETYQQALGKMEPAERAELSLIHVEHREAANTLRQHIHELGGMPEPNSGLWRTCARFADATAKLFGANAALSALKKGEEIGINDYESALLDSAVPGNSKELIRSALLPRTEIHVRRLEQLLQGRH